LAQLRCLRCAARTERDSESLSMALFSNARNKLGRRYDDGKGVSKNLVVALQWYLKALGHGI
jgi:TPR repeat protein